MNVLETEPDGPLESKIIEGAFVLLPKNNDWQTLNTIALNLLNESDAKAPMPIDSTIEIQNGTFQAGLAAQTARRLEKLGFTVIKVGNAPKRDFSKTIIFDLSNGNKEEALNLLQHELNAGVSLSLPTWLQSKVQPEEFLFNSPPEANAKSREADFIVVLGTDIVQQATGNR
jgi:hypothetical protein